VPSGRVMFAKRRGLRVTAQEVIIPVRPPAEVRQPSVKRLGVVLLVTALNLRMAVAALSPVLNQVEHDTGLSSTQAGLLSTVPVLCFGLFALVTPPLIRRFGMERLLLLVLVVITAGIALRVLPPLAALFAGTAVLGMGIAVGNVLVPGLIKQDFSRQAGLMTGLYSVTLFVGPAISAGLTVPLTHATGLGWRPAIAVWGGLAVICIGLFAPHAMSRPTPRRQAGRTQPMPRGLWSDPLAWMVAGFMGLQSLGYYSCVAWIPTLFEAHHMSAGQAGWLLSYSSFPGLAAALVTPLVIRGRSRRAATTVVIATVACGTGYVGLAIAPVAMPYVWLTILGLGQGMCISLALGFIVARAPDVQHTARLSTMAQGVGYTIASVGPFGLGALHDLTGGWMIPMLALTGILLPMLLTGLGASRNRHVLDQHRLDPRRLDPRHLGPGLLAGAVPPPRRKGGAHRKS
jgi:CP family cyanate transporter-like MFS transporter